MKLYLKFDFNTLGKAILDDLLGGRNIRYRIASFGEVEFLDAVSKKEMEEITASLGTYGIEIIENQKSALVQKVKDVIFDMVSSEKDVNVKASVYLAEQLNHSYGYLSNLFSEVTYTSIENYIILQKIEHAKQLIVNDKLTLTEIAYRLNYSSVAHLSTQFKNTTGITPSQFQKIVAKRREIANMK
ncbi:helix-turn-helix domain-containing protein [Chryseobacterium sp. MFBS3-17]|uniref:helix-turn-helix domain-containing protein n=1 Tax=Chryseobacterium sp. MFBS3-17 TaxID=2886689 RepID=UPI001D0EFBA7|nr:AraC family transcriptional regulator [Chryseobacterium sp. MFBS3-17]MCC2590955.1 AraC family transcriptional regulator [Chryseobacterium sp. MFBS3-17]